MKRHMDRISFRTTAYFDRRLELLSTAGPLTPRLKLIHELVRRNFSFVDRIAVAVFDPFSNRLKTYVSSSAQEDPLELYEFPLIKARSLMESIVKGPRVVNDLSVFAEGRHEHTQKLRESGFQASYTVPILHDNAFRGFIFLNSYQKNCFTDEVIQELDVFCHLLSSTIERDGRGAEILEGALDLLAGSLPARAAGSEPRRGHMSRITRLITRELVAMGKCTFDDETTERLSRFAAFHDIGKLSLPESVLMKPLPLSPEEFDVVTQHPSKGVEIVDSIVKSFRLEGTPGLQMLRNIVLYHHEKIDGSGYPNRLQGDKIPIEARIVAVADIYDALTSDRPHRFPRSSEEAFDNLDKQRALLDTDCVAALFRCRKELESRIDLSTALTAPAGTCAIVSYSAV